MAFGGRAFGDEQPKYLNSPETPLYTKGSLLYAIDVARDGMRARNRAILVEGYVDCLMAHQYGFTETVAALGTALTAPQLHLVRRHAGEAVIFFDADLAGQKAAERAETLLDAVGSDALWDPTSGGATWAINRTGSFRASESFRVRVATLPPGHDPDTFLQAEGAEPFEGRITAARSIVAYALDLTLGADVAAGRTSKSGLLARAALALAKVADAAEAASVSREVGLKLGIDPVHLLDEARRLQASLRRPAAASKGPGGTKPSRSGPSAPERDLFWLLLNVPEARDVLLPMLDDRDVEDPGLRVIVVALAQRPGAVAESLMADLTDETARGLLGALLVEERPLEDPRASIEGFRRRLDLKRSRRRLREATRGIAEAQQHDSVTAPDAELRAVHQHAGVVRQFTGASAQSLDARDPAGPRDGDTIPKE